MLDLSAVKDEADKDSFAKREAGADADSFVKRGLLLSNLIGAVAGNDGDSSPKIVIEPGRFRDLERRHTLRAKIPRMAAGTTSCNSHE